MFLTPVWGAPAALQGLEGTAWRGDEVTVRQGQRRRKSLLAPQATSSEQLGGPPCTVTETRAPGPGLWEGRCSSLVGRDRLFCPKRKLRLPSSPSLLGSLRELSSLQK